MSCPSLSDRLRSKAIDFESLDGAFVPTVIDVEASGFGATSYPIEIGVALSNGSSFCRLVKPAADWTHWDPSAAGVHHISPGTLQVHGRSVRRVAEDLNKLLRGLTVYSDAWSQDLTWIGRLFDKADRFQGFQLESLRTVMSETQAANWAHVKRQVTKEMALTRHRASADARILQLTFLKTAGPA